MPITRQPTKREQIKDHVVQQIRDGGLRPGDPLMSQNQLAGLFGTTAVTVHKALTELAEVGVVYRQQGAGTFVGPSPDERRTRSMCLVLPGDHLDDPAVNPLYWARLQQIMQAFTRAASSDWVFSTRSFEPGCDLVEAARELRNYDGVFFHYSKEPRDLLAYLSAETDVPLVALGLPVAGLDAVTVDHDMVAGTALGVQYLHARGHRRIALVAVDADWSLLWIRGYEDGLRAVGLPVDPSLVIRVEDCLEAGTDAALELLARHADVDAVFVESDLRAVSLVHALQQAGRVVPRDIAVMGYDGLDHSTRQPPFLTTVSIPWPAMIRAGMQVLADHPGRRPPSRHLTLRGEICNGRTC